MFRGVHYPLTGDPDDCLAVRRRELDRLRINRDGDPNRQAGELIGDGPEGPARVGGIWCRQLGEHPARSGERAPRCDRQRMLAAGVVRDLAP